MLCVGNVQRDGVKPRPSGRGYCQTLTRAGLGGISGACVLVSWRLKPPCLVGGVWFFCFTLSAWFLHGEWSAFRYVFTSLKRHNMMSDTIHAPPMYVIPPNPRHGLCLWRFCRHSIRGQNVSIPSSHCVVSCGSQPPKQVGSNFQSV